MTEQKTFKPIMKISNHKVEDYKSNINFIFQSIKDILPELEDYFLDGKRSLNKNSILEKIAQNFGYKNLESMRVYADTSFYELLADLICTIALYLNNKDAPFLLTRKENQKEKETPKALLEKIKELLNDVEDELSIISVQYNLPTGEQSYLAGSFAKIRTDLETLIEEEKK